MLMERFDFTSSSWLNVFKICSFNQKARHHARFLICIERIVTKPAIHLLSSMFGYRLPFYVFLLLISFFIVSRVAEVNRFVLSEPTDLYAYWRVPPLGNSLHN